MEKEITRKAKWRAKAIDDTERRNCHAHSLVVPKWVAWIGNVFLSYAKEYPDALGLNSGFLPAHVQKWPEPKI